MAVIDFNTGDITDRVLDTPVPAQQDPAPANQGGVIDLETGRYVNDQTQQPAIQEKPAQEPGIFDFFTGTSKKERTPELGTLPEFGSTKEGDTFKIALGLLSTFDEKAQQDIIQAAIPEAVFEKTPDGSIIIEVPTKDGGTRRSVLNRPGLSAQDLTTATAQVLSYLPTARIAGLGKTILQKMGIGAAGSAATSQALQETGMALGRKERDPTETAIAAVTGGLAEGVVPAVQAVRASRQAAKTGIARGEVDQVAANVQAAREAGAATDIPLYQAQQTGVPVQLERQAFVAQLPAGTQASVKGLTEQNKAAGDAVTNFLRQIAPDESVISASEKVRSAAKDAVSAVKQARSEASSPIYKQAFRRQRKGQLDLIDTSSLETKILQMSRQFDPAGEIAKNLTSSLKKIQQAKGDLQKLHLAKTEIDQTINTFGANSVGNTTKRFMTDIQRDLTNSLVDQSPSYRAARSEFMRTSPAVTRMQESIIGKISELDDTQLKQVTSKIFDPANTSKNILDARKAITDVSPDAWNAIVRRELESRLGSIKSTAEAGTVENIPGQLFRALFPNDKKTKVLFSALSGDAKKNLKYLQTALGRARLGRPGGSQTAAREEIKRELRGGVFQSLRNLFRNPINTLTSTGESALFDKRVKALSKALYDPTWKLEMRALRQFSPKSPAAGRALTQIINDIESSEENQ